MKKTDSNETSNQILFLDTAIEEFLARIRIVTVTEAIQGALARPLTGDERQVVGKLKRFLRHQLEHSTFDELLNFDQKTPETKS